MTTYIAGYDGSDAGRRAVALAARLAEPTGAQVVAATVYPAAARTDAARREALDLLAAVAAPGVEPVAVPAGSAAEGLHRLAEEREAGLLVVGTTHRGPAGRLVPGSVGERLLHGAPCPVTVVPAGTDPDAPLARIGVAFDGRPASRDAVRIAERLARASGGTVMLIAVHEPFLTSYVAPGAPVSSLDYDTEMLRALQDEAREATVELPADLRSAPLVLTGPAGPTLAEAAERERLDLLVTGSRGYGPVRSVLAGSVSRHLVDHAPCPVLVVPRAVRTAAPVAA